MAPLTSPALTVQQTHTLNSVSLSLSSKQKVSLFTEMMEQQKTQRSSLIISIRVPIHPTSALSVSHSSPLFFTLPLLDLCLCLSFLFAECPAQLASTFSLFAEGIVPCMSSVAIRKKGLDERCFSGPRPPHLWMETIELLFRTRWPHTYTPTARKLPSVLQL